MTPLLIWDYLMARKNALLPMPHPRLTHHMRILTCHDLITGAIPFRLHLLHIKGTHNNYYAFIMEYCYISHRMTGHNLPSKFHPLYIRETYSDGCSIAGNSCFSFRSKDHVPYSYSNRHKIGLFCCYSLNDKCFSS